ncbi:hypothetical protein [Halomonas mongoliensis]|uniref:hypothetical protein n=1 Tax=Halomonas mongoliensis TaxID=321265 RepID=UPI00403B377B
MSLYLQTAAFIPWFLRGLAILAKASPWKTVFVILAMAFARAASVLALLLPLKVVILAGSEGVPRYFQFFIGPDQKTQWVIYLAVFSIVLYLIKMALDSLSENMLKGASIKVVGNSTKLNIFNNQDEKAKVYLMQFCRIAAYCLFFFAGLLLLFYIQKALFAFILVAIFSLFAFTGNVLFGSDEITPTKARLYISEKYRSYVNTLSSIVFLFAFLVILTPFLIGEVERNLIFSLLSLLLVRQMLTVGSSGVVSAVALLRKKDQVDGLLHPEKTYEKKENNISVAFRDLFSRPERDMLINATLGLGNGGRVLSSSWEDSYIVGVSTFSFTFRMDSSNDKIFQLNVFMPYKKHFLENEDFLFEYIGRQEVMAPNVIARFSHRSFECQILDSGPPVSSLTDYKAIEKNVLENLWCNVPSKSLVKAYRSSHLLLHDRINRKLLDKLKVAISSDKEKEEYDWMLQNLEKINARLASLPLCIHNPDISRKTVVINEEKDSYLVTTWVRWRIDPLGAHLPNDYTDDDISALIEVISFARDDVANCDMKSVKLSWYCCKLDRDIKNGRYNKAKEHISRIKIIFC